MKKVRKGLSLLIVFLLVFSMIPTNSFPVFAAEGESIDNMNALSALGIDTSKMPDGYDANSQNNPYGKNTITVNPVSELFTASMKTTSVTEGETTVDKYYQTAVLRGHDGILTGTSDLFYNDNKNTTNNLLTISESDSNKLNQSYAAFDASSGNFNGKGMKGQVVTVAAGALQSKGGIYMYFTDPITGNISDSIEILDKTKTIGNAGKYDGEDFASQPYQLQNYLQVTTGDFDGDGLDEVAVYVPEQGNSRISIYKLQTSSTSGENLYLDSTKWSLAWTYAFNEAPYVSNMVSIVSGDFNEDGTDDVAMTWGTYYGPEYSTSCKAAVLYGDKYGKMLQINKTIGLDYSNSEIVRAAFTYGDIDGNQTDELILGGQLVSDINNKITSTRVIMMYSYDGKNDKFTLNYANNFKVIADKDKNNKYPAGEDGLYWSTPACTVNIAAVKMDGMGKAASIYMDSVLYKYGNDGLEIMTGGELDELASMKDTRVGTNGTTHPYYAEFGIVAGDFDGDGKETIQVMQYFLPYSKTYSYSSGWWFWEENWTETDVLDGKFVMHSIYSSNNTLNFKSNNYGTNLNAYYCAVNTDEDTCYMEYTGDHYINYTDPKVLAVLASAPYFNDIAIQEDSSGYMEASTEYTSTSGSSTGESSSHTLSIGAYVSFEQDFEVFGIKVASMEAEAAYTHGFTWETENTSTLEQSVSYGTDAGQDAVAFYSIPMEVYVYKSYHPILENGVITYKEQLMTVNIPHTAAIATMSLEKYESIAADYDELPQISGNILNHKVGDPSTYPTNVAEFAANLDKSNSEANAIVYNGDWAGVNFGGLGYIGQEIAMTQETSKSFSNSDGIDTKIGAGAGGFKVGITAGYEYGYGSCTVTTSGSSFTGTVYNMPIEAEEYGYYYAWKLFAFMYDDGANSFPIVDYLVTDVTTPPELPNDFSQDTSRTTDTENCLTWSYKDGAAGFQLFRYYEFPDGSGSYEIGPIIKASDFEKYDEATNTKYYSYLDEGLSPYTDYDYQIQVIGAAQPTDSILSPVLTARTKTGVGYPDIELDKTNMLVYPDKSSSVTAYIKNSEIYTQGAKFQWQKLIDGIWTDITGANKATFTLYEAGLADEGEYRSRINVIYESYYISAYSKSVFVDYEKRNSTISDVEIEDVTGSGPKLTVWVGHTYTDISSIPTGNVTFEIKSTNYVKSYTSDISENGYATVDTTELPLGVYEIKAYYSGSRVFKSISSNEAAYLSGSSDGYLLEINENIIYGDEVLYDINKVTKVDNTTVLSPAGDDLTYKITKAEQILTYKTYYIWSYAITIPVWETVMTEQDGWVSASTITAKQAGTFTLSAYENDIEVASKSFNVSKRNITIVANDKYATAKTSEATHPTVNDDLNISVGTLALDDSIDDLGLYVKALDTAEKEVTISSTTDPGNYTIIGAVKVYSSVLSNYNIEFTKGLYTLTGETFTVNGISEKLLGKDVGIVEVLSPANHSYWSTKYQNGTQLIFTATPNTGYSIADWYIMDNATSKYIAQNNNTNKLIYTMKSEPLSIKVIFKVEGNTLTYKVKDDDANLTGSIVCTSSDSFSSGAIVIENATYDFKAIPQEGYHFKEWQKFVFGMGTSYLNGSVDEAGYHTISLTMGNKSTILYAVFERDSYTLNLGSHLEAWYMDNSDNDTSTPDEKVIVLSGQTIKGDKEVTVEPAAGYLINSSAMWYKDGQAVENSTGEQSYSFNITADTLIEAETINKPINIDFAIQNSGGDENSVQIKINDETVLAENLEQIEGGSKVEFIAEPAYGYLFDKWIINGVNDYDSGPNITIGAIGEDMSITAVFKENENYTIDVFFDTQGNHGNLSYTINGGDEISITTPTAINVYENDELVIYANMDNDFMVGKWIVDEVEYQTTLKTWTLDNIDSDHTINVFFTPMAYYTVEYASSDGGTINATMDEIPFESGNTNIGGGTKIIFTAEPEEGMMVDYWEINGELVSTKNNTVYVDDMYTIDALSGNINAFVSFTPEIKHDVITDLNNASVDMVFDPLDYANEFEGVTTVIDRTALTATIIPDEGYILSNVNVVGNEGEFEGFDSIEVNEDGSWTCEIFSITDDIIISATGEKTYNIISSSSKGGNVTLSKSTAIAGEEITITAYPSRNYDFEGWKVTYVENTSEGGIVVDVLLNDKAKSPAMFIMPSADVTVAAMFKYNAPIPNGGGGGGVLIKTYEITTTANEGGIITPNDVVAEEGSNITFMIKPNDGYKISDVKVNGKSIGVVSSYTFENVAEEGSIEALFEKITYVKFDDVSENSWYYDSVNFVVTMGLFKGTSDNYFSPELSMTRGMFVTVLGRLYEITEGGSIISSNSAKFTDVLNGQYYYDSVKWSFENNIVKGISENEFRPDLELTREQIAALMYRYAVFAGLSTSDNADIKTFDDYDEISIWANDAMSWAVGSGIMNGRPDNTLDPDGNVLRSEAAAILQRFYEKLINN